ncbi:thymidine kinase [Membranihabitans marinus]|uniref:thymidine kinase n=1 Tax=Membranihabitans marinus TaxID=1227546 RepID=UPI001F02C0E7|nr:thymidine kinase [Membranihabitans marinus]
MFIEPHAHKQRSGWIEVISGCMFSGKTEELIRRLKREQIARRQVMVFKKSYDNRYSEKEVISHNSSAIESINIDFIQEIYHWIEDCPVIGIDEAQFFDDEIVDVVQDLALKGRRVIITGLDMDYMGKPFGSVPQLMAVAEYVTKLHAICKHCGSLATHSYRLIPSKIKILLGEKDQYEARCRLCFDMGNILDFEPK